MASKNPNTPTRTRATRSTARPAAPRRRPATRTVSPTESATGLVAGEGAGIDAPASSSIDYAEQVRVRAYFLHLERRGRPGNPVEDWLAAERELANADSRQA